MSTKTYVGIDNIMCSYVNKERMGLNMCIEVHLDLDISYNR